MGETKQEIMAITEQYPAEIHANRENLWPVFIDAKCRGKNTRWNVDKLKIDGKTISTPKDGIKDINLDVAKEAMQLKVKHSDLQSRNNNPHSKGCLVSNRSCGSWPNAFE